jgi:hypothetical protein
MIDLLGLAGSQSNLLIDLIVMGFATWRISSLCVHEAGPWDILARFRYFIGVRYDEWSNPVGTNVFAQALMCVYCTSVWVAGFVALVYYLLPWLRLLILALAVSALAIIIEEINGTSRD